MGLGHEPGGGAERLPAWAFGLWLHVSARAGFGEQEALLHLDQAAAWDLPVTGVHVDATGASAVELVAVRRLAEAVRSRGLRVSVSLAAGNGDEGEADAVWRESGVPHWVEGAHPVGGAGGREDLAALKRELPFEVLTSRALLDVPWALDEEAVEITRHFARLKNRLMPFMLASAAEARDRGVPVLRTMDVEFPEDPACRDLDGQYMLGPSLLVAPVLSADGVVEFYLPDGVWTSPLTGEQVVGGRWVTDTHGYDSLPLFARPGAIIAWGSELQRSDYDVLGGLELDVFDGGPLGARELRLVNSDGTPIVVTVVVQNPMATAHLADGTEVAAQLV
jgi:alpha-glucosidase (family GH31 glycosyl hydrolase)